MAIATDDYVLGTDTGELSRLGIQHRVWREATFHCWEQAGIRRGSRVLDVGAGPGYATADLAERVGPEGRVISVERSGRFVEAARAMCGGLGLENIDFHCLDLMEEELPATGADASWCRWVACFLPSPALLVEKLARAIRPGGVAIFHEFFDYSTWRFAAEYPHFEQFVRTIMTSWRTSGGEPNIARALPSLLTDAGFALRSATPRICAVRPGDAMWEWPASFVEVNLQRLGELGFIDEAFASAVRKEFHAAERDAATLMLTPVLLEIIAERRAD